MKGRKPKPVHQQFAEGDPSKRGTHKLDQLKAALPKAQRGLPDPPNHVEGFAREQWFIWKRDLELMQMDYSADAVMLEGACINYARAIEADEIGFKLKNHPAVARSNIAWRNVRMFCSELGLSHVARQRLAVEVGETGSTDELTDLLNGPRVQRPNS